jgi:hypothetical protein
MIRAGLVLVTVLAVGCGGLSLSDFQQQVNAARTCDEAAGDTCRLAGASQCLCPTPVNSAKAADIDRVAQSVACGAAVHCVQMLNPRCANGTCVADIQ